MTEGRGEEFFVRYGFKIKDDMAPLEDSEWDAISSALNDYQDYGTEEANLADSIQLKISTIYRLTENDSE